MDYYQLPLRFDHLIFKKDLDKCKNIGDSIFNNIHLILMTAYGDYRLDGSYGCSIWENDFENIVSVNKWKEEVKLHITEVIKRHEPRLSNVKVEAEINESEITSKGSKKMQRIKKLVEIKVSGRIASTNEPFSCVDRLYVSPLSFEQDN